MHLRDRIFITILLLSTFVLMGAESSHIQSVEEGREAYEEGRYDESAEHFSDALTGGGSPDVLQYNIGNAQYKAGDYEDAEASFRKALGENAESPDEYYNLGNTLSMQAESAAEIGEFDTAGEYFKQAGDAYRDTLEKDYTDVDAIHNLEYVKRRLEEIEEQKQSEPSEGEDESDSGDDESESQDESEQGQQEIEGDSSGDREQDSSDEESQEGDEQGQDGDRQDEGEQGEEGEESETDDGKPGRQDDGLGLSEQEIEALLDYFEQKERMQDSRREYRMPINPWDPDWPSGPWDDDFNRPQQEEEDWVDW